MQQTSLDAYFQVVVPRLSQRQLQVLEVIEERGPISNKQIAAYMQRPVNEVTPRTLELRKLGKVASAYVADDGGRKAHFWSVPEPRELYVDEVA